MHTAQSGGWRLSFVSDQVFEASSTIVSLSFMQERQKSPGHSSRSSGIATMSERGP